MDIVAEDIKAIRELLQQHLEKGDVLVAYEIEKPVVTKNDLYFFRDQESYDHFSKRDEEGDKVYFEYGTRHLLNCMEAIDDHKINFATSEQFYHSNGIYSIFDPMLTTSREALKQQIKDLGFDERIFPALDYYSEFPRDRFNLPQRERNNHEKTEFLLHFEKHPKDLGYVLTGYDCTLRIAPEIPSITVNGINAKELDGAMRSIDWSIDHHADSLVETYIKTPDGNDFLERLDMIIRDVNRLYKYNTEGRDAAERLMYKHWYGEPWEPTEILLEHVRKIFEWKKEVDLIATPEITVGETYRQLKENAQLCAGAMPVTREALQACLGQESEIRPGEELLTLARYLDKINMKSLEMDLLKNGWEAPHFNLQRHFDNKSECFDITVDNEVQQEKMQCLLQFEDAGNGWYLFKQYDATLYHQVAISHAHINGINTHYLEDAMKKADWFYEYSESTAAWEKGFAEVRKINDALNTLCKDETGRVIATYLWNNHVPLFTIGKPVLIRKCEEAQHLYQCMRFTAQIPVHAAHKELKNVVLKNELHHHELHSLVKDQTTVAPTQKDNGKPKHSHRPKIH